MGTSMTCSTRVNRTLPGPLKDATSDNHERGYVLSVDHDDAAAPLIEEEDEYPLDSPREQQTLPYPDELAPDNNTQPSLEKERPGSGEEIGSQLSRQTTNESVKIAETEHHKAALLTSTNALFPPLPSWDSSSPARRAQYLAYRVSAFFLSLAFLSVIVLGSLFTSLPAACLRLYHKWSGVNPDLGRPFFDEEERRSQRRKEADDAWVRKTALSTEPGEPSQLEQVYPPTEGGPDPIICDIGYYARRVGLNVEEFDVETEDGFIISLWHVHDPKEREGSDSGACHGDSEGSPTGTRRRSTRSEDRKPKYPILLMHGLLQSAGAYCVNDDDSLAFYLCKAGYDVWLGNNRCGFAPRHKTLKYGDPRLWCWNIYHMGVMDLDALTSKVLEETGFLKLGLVCHSQGTTQTFVALAKEQRPELGGKISVFCALAPAAYAGPLIGKMYFKFMRVISPAAFRLMFGIHGFIPFMMTMHRVMAPRLYGWLGYRVFAFLFNWTDDRWDRGLRDRMFRFSPVYVSAESMSWWLGRDGFAKHRCILSTKEVVRAEEKVDGEMDGSSNPAGQEMGQGPVSPTFERAVETFIRKKPRGATAWYDDRVPPFALWVAGSDDLVDGRRLLRRFERGREPFVKVVHSKVIPEYEHLDVIWAMDAVDQVFVEVKEVLWKTCDARDECRIPRGCEDVGAWVPATRTEDEDEDDGQSSSSED